MSITASNAITSILDGVFIWNKYCKTRLIGPPLSLKMVQQLRDTKTNTVKTTCFSVLAGFDRTTHQSIPIREEYKQLIREFEGSL